MLDHQHLVVRGVPLSDFFFVAVVVGGLPLGGLLDLLIASDAVAMTLLSAILLPLVVGFAWTIHAEERAIDNQLAAVRSAS